MKIGLFMFYPRALWIGGSGEGMIRRIREYLPATGHQAEFFDLWNPRDDFDVLHILACNREVLEFAEVARGRGLKVVMSVFEYRAWSPWRLRAGRFASRLMGARSNHALRARVLRRMDRLIVSSPAMGRYVGTYYGVPAGRCSTVPWGVAPFFLSATPDLFIAQHGRRDFVLCAGRIGSRKNQLGILRCLDGSGLPVVFIGGAEPLEPDYAREFEREVKARPHALWIRELVQQAPLLASAYAACRVHVQASRGLPEYPGLANVEAAGAGAAVVATDNPVVRYYLGDHAHYCNADSEDSIRRAILRAHAQGGSAALRADIRERFSWARVIRDLARVYEEVAAGPQPG
jgi:glycosyltransferase involved in cell wall biosynthesis